MCKFDSEFIHIILHKSNIINRECAKHADSCSPSVNLGWGLGISIVNKSLKLYIEQSYGNYWDIYFYYNYAYNSL